MAIKVGSAVLSVDFGHLQEELDKASSADLFQFDIMDGNFVPNLTYGPPVIKSLKTDIFTEAHLMASNPDILLKDLADAGVKRIIVHQETLKGPEKTIQAIHDLGCEVGIALNPSTPLDSIKPFLDKLDMVLIMTVTPGFGGQAFQPEMLDKIKALRNIFSKDIEVDGGITDKTAKEVVEAGATILISGSYVFRNKDGLTPDGALENLRRAAE